MDPKERRTGSTGKNQEDGTLTSEYAAREEEKEARKKECPSLIVRRRKVG